MTKTTPTIKGGDSSIRAAEAASRLEEGRGAHSPRNGRSPRGGQSPRGDEGANPSFKHALGFHETETVFLNLPEDLCCLALSSWFVESVKHRWRGLGFFFATAAIQFIFLFYMAIVVYYKIDEEFSDCTAPTLMSFCAVYVYGSAVIADFTSHQPLQVAICCERVRNVEGNYVVPIRPTSTCMRMLLLAVPMLQIVIEITVLIVGVLYLLLTDSVDDLVLNTVAVNFISEIDDMLYRNVANKATQQRLAKYQFEHLCGIEDGETGIQNTSKLTKRLVWWEKLLPRIWGAMALAIALLGRIYLTENQCPWYETSLSDSR